MKDELNTNNSKKLIIEVSIVFCTIILIIGATTAYFAQSNTKETGNIVSTDQVSLLFDDNDDYMFGNLIPVNEEDVLKFASKDNDMCKYQEGMYACNLYEFTITNNSNVAQELMITLNPTFNEFGNLHYILLDKNKDDISLDNVPVSNDHINEINSIEIANKVVLGSGSSKTYTIVYYIKNLEDINQTDQDANKQFYASVRVDSITTGTYAETLMESRCYEYEEITDGEYTGTYKLTKFNGINHDTGAADNTCGVAQNGDFYSVNVPSKLKDEEGNELEISTLGNRLFTAVDFEDEIANKYIYINDLKMETGIEVLENSDNYYFGTFSGLGYNIVNNTIISELNIEIPSTMKYIGIASFSTVSLVDILIPSSVVEIRDAAFYRDFNLNKVIFEGADTNTSSLKLIGPHVFTQCNLNYSETDPLLIPASVEMISEDAFYTEQLSHNKNLKAIKYTGNYLNDFHVNWYDKDYIKLITE